MLRLSNRGGGITEITTTHGKCDRMFDLRICILIGRIIYAGINYEITRLLSLLRIHIQTHLHPFSNVLATVVYGKASGDQTLILHCAKKCK